MKQAVILAGGKGTRLRDRLGDLPKPLIDVCGTPLLERQILLLKKYDFTDVLILVNYASDKIIEFCSARSNWGMSISCINDGEPLGTAGATLKVFDRLEKEFLVVYGDTMLEVDLDRFYRFHRSFNAAAASLFLHPNDHPADSDLVDMDDEYNIIGFYPYPHETNSFYPNLVNAALYWVNKTALAPWSSNRKMLDFGRDLFPLMLANGHSLKGYNSTEYIKDCGTPKRLDTVSEDLSTGKIARSSLSNKRAAVFLDRDGTINVEIDHLSSVNDFRLIAGAGNAIRALNRSEYLTCVITNQPVVARGDCTLAELKVVHNKMETMLGSEGAFIDRIYYCPHHPEKGHSGEVQALKIDCSCRKPKTGMIDLAVKDLNVDLTKSWFVGDTSGDIMTAKNAGLKSVLVETGYAGLDHKFPVVPDFIVPDIAAAISFILQLFPKILRHAEERIIEIEPGGLVFMGGLSRSGKSTYASVLKYAFRKRGISCHVLALDRWLKNEKDRGDNVLERYDIPAIESVIKRLSKPRHGVVEFELPAYHKLKKISIPAAEKISIGPDDIVIIEGTIALLFAGETLPSTQRMRVIFNEEERKKRVINEYLLRKYSNLEAAAIYERRQSDEAPIIGNVKAAVTDIDMNMFYL